MENYAHASSDRSRSAFQNSWDTWRPLLDSLQLSRVIPDASNVIGGSLADIVKGAVTQHSNKHEFKLALEHVSSAVLAKPPYQLNDAQIGVIQHLHVPDVMKKIARKHHADDDELGIVWKEGMKVLGVLPVADLNVTLSKLTPLLDYKNFSKADVADACRYIESVRNMTPPVKNLSVVCVKRFEKAKKYSNNGTQQGVVADKGHRFA